MNFSFRTNQQQVVLVVSCSASQLSCRFSCSVQNEWSGKPQGDGLRYWLTVWGWPAIGAGSCSLLHAPTDRIYCNTAISVTSIQIRNLFESLALCITHSIYLSVSICFCPNISLTLLFQNSPSFSLLLARLLHSSHRKRSIVRYGTAS